MTAPLVSSLALLAAAVTWSLSAAALPGWEASSAVVFGVGLIAVSTVAVVGMVAGAARWALRMGIGTAAFLVLATATVPIETSIVIGAALAAVALAGLAGTSMRGMVRLRPSAEGPPRRAVLLGVVLLMSPPLWGFVVRDGLPAVTLVAAALCWVGMAIYLKATPIALLTARFVLPSSLVVLAVLSGWPEGVAVGVTAIATAALAWTVEARIAVQPLDRPGSIVPIPPELAPKDVLDAAGVDDRGRRKGDDPA